MARLGGELLVIVVGVLIALSTDTWIQTQQDRDSEGRHLVALLEDLRETVGALETSNDEREAIFDALTQLAGRDLDTVPPDSISRWVYGGLFLMGSFRPQLTAIRDIQSSDQLRLLTPAIRREIAEVDRATANLDQVEDDFTRSQQALVDPYLVERTPLASILAVADSLPLSPRPLTSADWRNLQTDQLRNAIAFKLSLGRVAAGRRRELSVQLGTLMRGVEARLEELGLGLEG